MAHSDPDNRDGPELGFQFRYRSGTSGKIFRKPVRNWSGTFGPVPAPELPVTGTSSAEISKFFQKKIFFSSKMTKNDEKNVFFFLNFEIEVPVSSAGIFLIPAGTGTSGYRNFRCRNFRLPKFRSISKI